MKKQFEVLYTRQKTQKTKTWHDGIIVIDNVKGTSRISLYKIDENGCKGEIVESLTSHAQNVNVSKISFPCHLIQLVDEESTGEADIEVKDIANSLSTSRDVPISSPTPKLSNFDYNNGNSTKINLVRKPFKAPLLKVNMDISGIIQSKTPKKISKLIQLDKISSKLGFIKALERISTFESFLD